MSGTFRMMNPRRAMTLAYTPYFPGFAHPSPQDTIPVCRNSPVLASTASRGPPLSPCECKPRKCQSVVTCVT